VICSHLLFSVQKENFAYKIYLRLGFEIILEKEEEFIMLKHFVKAILCYALELF
jgi:hypothetical protein